VFSGEVVSGKERAAEFNWRDSENHNSAGLAQRLIAELTGSELLHVWHYFGHGVVQAQGPALETAPGDDLSCTELAQPLTLTAAPRVVVLNACDSALPLAAHDGSAALTSFATVLLKRGTAALICMLKEVSPPTASATTEAVYRKLAESLFTNPLGLEDALHDVRMAIHDPDKPRWDFFCPVLYRRRVENEALFEYSDRRLTVWKMIQESKLTPVWPWYLYKAAIWSGVLARGRY
jgi:hypothetical protein